MNEMIFSKHHILVTGANGFIGKNLVVRLNELDNITVSTFVRGDELSLLPQLISRADTVIHLAGENRPIDEESFAIVNSGLTAELCKAIRTEFQSSGRRVSLVLASSTQAEQDNPYGLSKLAAEQYVQSLTKEIANRCLILRLPGVFGKWCKPDYNSVVATFCHNIANGLPITINDPTTKLRLVFVDDVTDTFIKFLSNSNLFPDLYFDIENQHVVKIGELAEKIYSFKNIEKTLTVGGVGKGFTRALYSTYLSYLTGSDFSYDLPKYADERGDFVEMLKTKNCGQFSYFTAHPGITRGGHYHHTKNEKFLVIRGEARFRFRNIITKDAYELITNGDKPQVVDTVPGWSHDITNIGDSELIVMLWANEIFDRDKPDTYAMSLDKK